MTETTSQAPRSVNIDANRDFLTMMIDGQLLGIPVLQVQDVLGPQRVTRVPLAPAEVEGSLNLRGRIVTAINLRRRLGILTNAEAASTMSVVVEHRGDLYSLIVDSVGEVLSLPADAAETAPATLDSLWRQHAVEIYQLKEQILVILDIAGMLDDMRIEDDISNEDGEAA